MSQTNDLYLDIGKDNLMDLIRDYDPRQRIKAIKIFIAFHQEDEPHRKNLRYQLSNLKSSKKITIWDSSDLFAGENMEEVSMKNLVDSNIVLFLVSPESTYENAIESKIKDIKKRVESESGSYIFVPIRVRSCNWKANSKDRCLPNAGQFITLSSNIDDAWKNVVLELQLIIYEILTP